MAKDRIESKYVTVAPGVELHILEKGEGKPLVFIPGLTFSGEIFKNQLEYFSSEYRVIAIDPRGQGYSAKTVEGCREFFSEYATGIMIQHKIEPDELEYLLDISGRTPYWICRQLFCDAVFSNYLEIAKDVGATLPSLMFIAEHWQDIAKPFVEAQLPGYDTYVMGGHLMFYEYPEKWNHVLEDFLNKL